MRTYSSQDICKNAIELIANLWLGESCYVCVTKGETSLGTSFESYFPLKEIRLSDGPFLDLQQKGKEYLLWLNPDSLLHFIGLKRDCHRKPDLMPAGSRKTYGEQARFGVDFLGSIFLPYR